MNKPKLISAKTLTLRGDNIFDKTTRLFVPWFCRDRFNFWNEYSSLNIADFNDEFILQGSEKDKSTDSMEDMLNRRAEEIIKKNKHIYLSYSGGVDSSTVLCALLNNGANGNNLTVIGSLDSVKEYPLLAEHIKKEKIPFSIHEDPCSCYFGAEGVLVTGWCADQLFGSNIHCKNPDLYFMPLRQALELYTDMEHMSPYQYSHTDLDKMECLIKEYGRRLGIDVRLWNEFTWLYNFGVKWSHVKDFTQNVLGFLYPKVEVCNFFEPLYFQNWSYQNHEKLLSINPHRKEHFKHYKHELKEYILKTLKDSEYYFTKAKINSMANTVSVRVPRTGVHDTEGYSLYLQKNNREFLNNTLYEMYAK